MNTACFTRLPNRSRLRASRNVSSTESTPLLIDTESAIVSLAGADDEETGVHMDEGSGSSPCSPSRPLTAREHHEYTLNSPRSLPGSPRMSRSWSPVARRGTSGLGSPSVNAPAPFFSDLDSSATTLTPRQRYERAVEELRSSWLQDCELDSIKYQDMYYRLVQRRMREHHRRLDAGPGTGAAAAAAAAEEEDGPCVRRWWQRFLVRMRTLLFDNWICGRRVVRRRARADIRRRLVHDVRCRQEKYTRRLEELNYVYRTSELENGGALEQVTFRQARYVSV